MKSVKVEPATEELENLEETEEEKEDGKEKREDEEENEEEREDGAEGGISDTENEEDQENPKESSGICKLVDILEGLVALTMSLLAVTSVLIAVGFVNHCVISEVTFLSIWLIIHGISVLSATLATVLWLDLREKSSATVTGLFILMILMILFSFIWMIIGNIAVGQWWSNGWVDSFPCYANLLNFTLAIVIIFDGCWVLVFLLAILRKINSSCYEIDAESTPTSINTKDDIPEFMVTEYFRSYVCLPSQRMNWQSCVGLAILLLYMILSIASLVTGALFEKRCPTSKLPLWLLVQGVSTLVTLGIVYCVRMAMHTGANTTKMFVLTYFPIAVFALFQIAWLAIGNDWAFLSREGEKVGRLNPPTGNGTRRLEFDACDSKLLVFYASVIVLLDLPIMVFLFMCIGIIIVLVIYFSSPCFPESWYQNSEEEKAKLEEEDDKPGEEEDKSGEEEDKPGEEEDKPGKDEPNEAKNDDSKHEYKQKADQVDLNITDAT